MREKDPIQLTEEERKVIERIKKAMMLLDLQEQKSERDMSNFSDIGNCGGTNKRTDLEL